MTITDKIRKIKESRLSECEKMFIDILNNLVEYKHKDYPNKIFYKLNGEIAIEHDLDINWLWFGNTMIINPLYNCNDTLSFLPKINKLYKQYNNIDCKFKLAFTTKETEWSKIP